MSILRRGLMSYFPTEIIVFETFQKQFTNTFTQQLTNNGLKIEEGNAYIQKIEGNTFVWNQLFDYDNNITSVVTIPTAVYLQQTNGVRSVFTSQGETVTAITSTDMLINLTHLYGTNTRGFSLATSTSAEQTATLSQFESLFPLSYYDYSPPRLMHMGLTKIESSGTQNITFTSAIDIDVKQITGKLNGSGESVSIFPNGMMQALEPDTIYKENGVWKAIVRNLTKTIDLSSITMTSYTTHYRYTFATTQALSANYSTTGPNIEPQVVCDKFMSSNYGILSASDKPGYCCVLKQSSSSYRTFFGISKTDYDAGNLPTVNFIYTNLTSQYKTYVLDDEWQTLLNTALRTIENGTEKLYPINTSTPTTAPLTLSMDYNVKDYEVKRICVENWGGHYIPGEITTKEATNVAQLGTVFNNKDIFTFNELRYFTKLQNLYNGHLVSGYAAGSFYGCSNLTSVTMPAAALTTISGAFRNAPKLNSIDLSPIASQSLTITRFLQLSSNNSTLQYVKLPGISYVGSFANVFSRRTGLTTIEIDGTADLSEVTGFSNTFYYCYALTTITGNITGIKQNISLSDSSNLTRESALVLLNGLATLASGTTKTITFHENTRRLLSATDDLIATNKGWNIAPTKYQTTFNLVGCQVVEEIIPYALNGLAWEVTINKPWNNTAYVGMTVTMGGNDITSTAWDETTRTISIANVSGDISISAEAMEVIEWEEHTYNVNRTFTEEPTNNNDETEDSNTSFVQINGNTFVWNQLFDYDNNITSVDTISGSVYLQQTDGVRSVFTSAGETVTATTSTDMLINLTHLYGTNTRSLALTQAQFEKLFPEEYYDYSAPRLIHLAITKFESTGTQDNTFTSVVNLPITSITGKLNGSGESVTIFPNGMGGANYSDKIYKENDVWKAEVRMFMTSINLNTATYVADANSAKRCVVPNSSGHVGFDTNSKSCACDYFLSATYSDIYNNRTPKSCTIWWQSGSSTYFVYPKTEYSAGNMPTVNIAYTMNNNSIKTYVLDDAWQTVLNNTFRVCENGKVKAYVEGATAGVPATAPITCYIAYVSRGYKVKNFCVSRWGGNYVSGELTAKEAAAVTDIKPVFDPTTYVVSDYKFSGKAMEYFNEFRYFTGVKVCCTTNTVKANTSAFMYCSKLKEITMPPNYIGKADNSNTILLSSMFMGCSALKRIDLSSWVIDSSKAVNLYSFVRSTGIEEIILPKGKINTFNSFAQNNTALKKIDMNGASFTANNNVLGNAFVGTTSLTTVIGGFPDVKAPCNVKDCPLTVASAIAILQNLSSSPVSGATVTFKNSLKTTYEADSDFNDAVTAAVNNGWNIAYAT